MKIMDENKPTAEEMGLTNEFVYATRIVDVLRKVDLTKKCDIDESIRVIEKVFIEFKNKILNNNI